MLVLSRRVDEAIRIGDIRVVVISFRDGKVRLGIDAPPEVPVHREEVWAARVRPTAARQALPLRGDVVSERKVKLLKCDACGREVRVENVAAPKLPKGWHEVSDYYGNAAHSCPAPSCVKWLAEAFEGFAVEPEGTR
jgi:carbon storage regulator